MRWMKELDKNIKKTASIAVLSLFGLIIIFYLIYIRFIVGEELVPVIPEFYHVFTITFALVAAIVALSNYLLRREEVDSKNSLEMYNYYDKRISSLRTYSNVKILKNVELSYASFDLSFFKYLENLINDLFQKYKGLDEGLKVLPTLYYKANFRDKEDYNKAVSLFVQAHKPPLSTFFRNLYYGKNECDLSPYTERINLLRKLFSDFENARINYRDTELLSDRLLDEGLISFLRFIQNYYLLIPRIKNEQVSLLIDPFGIQYYKDIYRFVEKRFSDIKQRKFKNFLETDQKLTKEMRGLLNEFYSIAY